MNSNEDQRMSVKLKTPNPLFEKWLIKWRDEAASKNSKMQYSFDNALKSLRKYPIPLESGRECLILKGFGEKLCKMLDEKLKEHKKLNGPFKTPLVQNGADNIQDEVPNAVTKKPRKKKAIENQLPDDNKSSKKASKPYIPAYGSGAYAILVTLYKQSQDPSYPGFLKKDEIIQLGTELLTNSSFTKPDPGSRYTAWSSMRTLISKSLVSKASHPPKFSLTADGVVLATKLCDNGGENGKFEHDDIVDISEEIQNELLDTWHPSVLDDFVGNEEPEPKTTAFVTSPLKPPQPKPPFQRFASTSSVPTSTSSKTIRKSVSANSIPSNGTSARTLKKYTSSSSISSSISTTSKAEYFVMAPESFDVILYVDNNETSGSSKMQGDAILIGLRKCNVNFEVKNLKVGDFIWICRDRVTGKELVLPYIIERKRMDDFASSIKDKRYYEQKFRLKKSGIENLTYLVESHGKNEFLGLPVQHIYQAATNTAMQDNFFIKFTENTRETVEYLANMSSILIEGFKGKTLASCAKEDLQPTDLNDELVSLMPFKEFNESSVKNKRMRVTDLFIKMLIQIKGLSVERALAITQKFPTPSVLKMEYDKLEPKAGEKLLASIKYGSNAKAIGLVLSRTVYQAFCKLLY